MIDRVEFGRTGHRSSRVIFGAAALGTMGQDPAKTAVFEVLEAFGVNHIDTAAAYGDSELRLRAVASPGIETTSFWPPRRVSVPVTRPVRAWNAP